MAMVESKHRATSDPEARRRVLEAIRDQKVEYVLFWFTDLEGHLKSFAITPAVALYARALRHGGVEPELSELPVADSPAVV